MKDCSTGFYCSERMKTLAWGPVARVQVVAWPWKGHDLQRGRAHPIASLESGGAGLHDLQSAVDTAYNKNQITTSEDAGVHQALSLKYFKEVSDPTPFNARAFQSDVQQARTPKDAKEANKQIVDQIRKGESLPVLASVIEKQQSVMDGMSVTAVVTHAQQLLSQESCSRDYTSQFVSSYIAPLLEKKMDTLDHVGLTLCLHALAKLDYKPKSLINKLAAKAQAVIPDLTARLLSQLCWSLVQLQIQLDTSYLSSLTRQSLVLVKSCNAQDCSTLCWSLALLGHSPSDGWLEAFESRSLEVLKEFTDQGLVNFIYGMAVMRCMPGASWWQEVLGHIEGQLQHYNHRSIGILAYSLVILNICPLQSWQDRLVMATGPVLESTSSQNLMHLAVALAHWQYGSHRLKEQWLPAFCEATQKIMEEFTPQGLTLTVYSMSRLGCNPPSSWISQFESTSMKCLEECTPQYVGTC